MGETTLRQALDDYKSIYMPYRNFAERTRVEYQNDLEDFIEYSTRSGIERVGGVGLPIIHRFVARLEEKGYSSLTRKRKVVAIRSFLSFLSQDGYIASNIADKVVLPFTESPTPHVLTNAESSSLRNACANSPRDKAIIELLLQTGIRLSELTRLTVNDLELGQGAGTVGIGGGSIRILGGGRGKERTIPLDLLACKALKKYLHARNKAVETVLFLNRFGEALGNRGVQKLLRKYLKSAGIGTASIHTLRHTFAVHHLARGEDRKQVQRLMGNKDPRSIEVYVDMASSYNSHI